MVWIDREANNHVRLGKSDRDNQLFRSHNTEGFVPPIRTVHPGGKKKKHAARPKRGTSGHIDIENLEGDWF